MCGVHVCAVGHACVYVSAHVCYARIDSRPLNMLKTRDSEMDRRLQMAYTT